MLVKICPKTNKMVMESDCKKCEKKKCENQNAKSVDNTLISIIEEHIKSQQMKHTCEECSFCKFKRIMETSHCDVKIYSCTNEKSKRFHEDMDDFHIQKRACRYFIKNSSQKN